MRRPQRMPQDKEEVMKENKMLDDLAQMASGAAGTLFDMKREVEAMAAAQVEALLRKTSLVTREEFEAVREMAQKSREETAALKAQIEALKPR